MIYERKWLNTVRYRAVLSIGIEMTWIRKLKLLSYVFDILDVLKVLKYWILKVALQNLSKSWNNC